MKSLRCVLSDAGEWEFEIVAGWMANPAGTITMPVWDAPVECGAWCRWGRSSALCWLRSALANCCCVSS